MSKSSAVLARHTVFIVTFRHFIVTGAAQHSVSEPKTVTILRYEYIEPPVHASQ